MSELNSDRLRTLFRPRGVALVGASDKSTFSQNAYANLCDAGFGDRTFLVNREGSDAHGVRAKRSCTQIDTAVDVAYMMVPKSAMADALSDVAAAGISNVVVLSSGYAEAGENGRHAQSELVALADELGLVLLGPNHLGFVNFVDRIPVCSMATVPTADHRGHVALLSQSGASSTAMLEYSVAANVGLSYMVTLGNEAMVTAGHAIDYMVDDPDTKAIAIFLETIRDPDRFAAAAARAANKGKAIVVLKVGSSELAARTAVAHTGALVGDDKVVDAVFRELGIIRVHSIEEMILTAGVAARVGVLHASGLAVVSLSGGACDIIADHADRIGAYLPELSENTRTTLTSVMPQYGTIQNPLDVTGAAVRDPTIFTRAIEAVASDPAVGVTMVVANIPWRDSQLPTATQDLLDAITAGIEQAETPTIFCNQVMVPITKATRSVLPDHVCIVPGLSQSTTALRNIIRWSDYVRRQRGMQNYSNEAKFPSLKNLTGAWSELQTRELLIQAGIPVIPAKLATRASEATTIAQEFGGQVAMKIVSADILHKSDVGGVRLGVDTDRVGETFTDIINAGHVVSGAAIDGVLVSPMRTGGLELLVGAVRDPDWGPVMAIAMGGVFVEILRDSVLARPPITPEQAAELIGRLRGYPLLLGARGSKPADIVLLSKVISDISLLIHALRDQVDSLEINPLRVEGSVIEALDAVAIWRTP